MAAPKWHVVVTAPVAIAAVIKYPPLSFLNIAVLGLVILLGIFIDVDHVLCSLRVAKKIWHLYVKRMPRGWFNWFKLDHFFRAITDAHREESLAGVFFINWGHTWKMTGVIVFLSFGVSLAFHFPAYLPFLAYALHMLVDAANRANAEYLASPLPLFLYRLIPAKLMKLTYYYDGKLS